MDFEEVRKKVVPVLRRYGVRRAGLFGSIARGDSGDGSDVDIVVEFSGDKSLMDLAGLKLDAEEKLGRRVDVLTYASIHPLLRSRILGEQRGFVIRANCVRRTHSGIHRRHNKIHKKRL